MAHLAALIFPLGTLAFLLGSPHSTAGVVAALAGVVLVVSIDTWAGPARRRPERTGAAAWPYDLLLHALALIQLASVVLLARTVMLRGFCFETIVAGYLVGNASGASAIVVAHELIHRRGLFARTLGRAMLVTVGYEHFYTEHLRGHHARVATAADPATARFGETYYQFLRRTIPGQLKSAWRLDRRRVLQGLTAEALFVGAIAVVFGPIALAFHLWHCASAIGLLEAVNYFEHWGLTRRGACVGGTDSWDTESWFSTYTLVGLTRHADHHAHPSRPYHQLRAVDESPKLPYGYYAMVTLAQCANGRFRRLMTAELRRRSLGPFAAATARTPPPATT